MSELNLTVLLDKRVLFVDDDETTREVMNSTLSRRFKEVYLAKNGKEGFEVFEAQKPDIVITDIEMPVMNGLKLLEKIKEIEPTKPVVVVTAFSDEAHKASKADAIIIKPVNRNNLFTALVDMCE
ncbi:MAG: response regulator transcription factor [Campylobacterales bacterium]